MGLIKAGFSAIGKLFIVIALAGTFLVGLVGVVYLSLRGEEVKVPEIVGKNFTDSEKELEGMGLKVKRRALRYSEEKPNTVLEQLPRPGETVKTGQTILVVLSQSNPDGQEAPATIKKNDQQEEDVTPPDLEIPSDKKKTNKNANVKKATTTRDVVSDKSNKNTSTNSATDDSVNKSMTNSNSSKSANTSTPASPANKAVTPPANKTTTPSSNKPAATTTAPKPAAAKTPTSGEMRSRRVQ